MAGLSGAEDPESMPKETSVFALHVPILEAKATGQPKGVPLWDAQEGTGEGTGKTSTAKGRSQSEATGQPVRKEKKKWVCGFTHSGWLG